MLNAEVNGIELRKSLNLRLQPSASAFSTQHYFGVAAGAGTIWMIVLNRAGSAPRFGLR